MTDPVQKTALVRYDSGEERRVRLDELFGAFEVSQVGGKKERDGDKSSGAVGSREVGRGNVSRDSSPLSALSSVSGDES